MEVVDTREETLTLALESILRWTDRRFDFEPGLQDSWIVSSIAKVASVALEGK